ncbi:MAG: AMP-binding protein, partial [Dehalococcoidia bacterium]
MSDTLPKLLKQKYELYGDRRIALRVKHHGIWPAYTWQDFYHNVKQLSLGLISLGLEAGDKVAILGETKPEAYFTELATQAANCVVVGVFTDCSIEEVKYYLEHSDCRFAVVQDQEQVDKLLAIKDDLPLLKKVIYWDPKGLWNYDDPILMDFKEVQRLGREYEKEHPSLFEQKIENGKEDDLALHLYTSGTTGLPKAAMTTHKGLLNLVKTMSSLDNWQEGERYVAALSLAWIGEQLFGIGGTLVSGRIAHFPEKPELIQENYREIAPQVVFFGTRQWESLNRTVQAKIVDAHPLKRFFFRLFLPVGYKTGEVQSIKRFPLFWRALRFLAYLVVFRPLADKLGLLGIRLAYTAGASISPVTVDFFKAIGINIRQTYGSTEMSLITLHEMDDLNAESSGTPIRGTEVCISDEGEILVKGDMVYSGYYKDVEATQEKHTDTGWYRSGDFGHITDEGHLIVMDRMYDLVALADGHRFSPQYIET